MFVSDLCADSAAVSKAHGEVFCSLRPASTMVQAARMYNQVGALHCALRTAHCAAPHPHSGCGKGGVRVCC